MLHKIRVLVHFHNPARAHTQVLKRKKKRKKERKKERKKKRKKEICIFIYI